MRARRASWGTLSWSSHLAGGTSVAMSVRTGGTPVPDGSWSGFRAIAASGAAIGGSSRYIQYRAALIDDRSSLDSRPARRDDWLRHRRAAPLATNDGFSLNEDAVLTVVAPGVLTNDSDPGGER